MLNRTLTLSRSFAATLAFPSAPGVNAALNWQLARALVTPRSQVLVNSASGAAQGGSPG